MVTFCVRLDSLTDMVTFCVRLDSLTEDKNKRTRPKMRPVLVHVTHMAFYGLTLSGKNRKTFFDF